MNPFAAFARMLAPAVPPQAIRMEIFQLGSRHQGDPLAGALVELKSARLDSDRLRLLRAVVDHLSRRDRVPASF